MMHVSTTLSTNSQTHPSPSIDVAFALKAARLGVWEVDTQTNKLHWDDRCRELFGIFNNSQVTYAEAIQYIHPDDRDRVDQAVARAIDPRGDGHYDETYRTIGADDGQLRWVRFFGQRIFTEAGGLVRFAGVALDLTASLEEQQQQQRVKKSLEETAERTREAVERARAEAALRVSEAKFRALIEQAPVATSLYVGEEMVVELANDTMLRYWGKEASIIGKPLREALPELDGQPFHQLLTDVYATGVVHVEQSARADLVVDGRLRTYYFDYTYKPLFDQHGRVYAIMNMATDVTEQVLARRELEVSEGRFRSLIQEASVPTMLMTGPHHVIEIANGNMIRMLGKDASILGRPATEAVPELATQPFIQLLHQVYTTGIAYEAKAMPGELVNNGISQTHYFDFTYKAMRNADGDVYGVMAMAVDVTEQVLVRQRIEQSQQQLLALFEQAPVGIAIISEDDLTFRLVNTFYCELVGRSSGQLIDKPLLDAMPELRGQGFDALLRGVFATGVPYHAKEVPVQVVRNNELETIYVDFTYQPHRNRTTGNAPVHSILVVCTDVTQQVRSRRQVEASETKLRSLIQAAPVAIGLFIGRDLVVDMPNQTFIDIVGKGPDIVGKPLREVMPELITENQPFLQILDDVFTTGRAFHSYGSRVDIVRQGVMTHNYYNISYSPLLDEKGEIYAILDVAVDVTGQVQAQKSLEETEADLRATIELAELVTWKLDIKRGTITYSPRFMDWLGFSDNTKELDEAYNPLPDEYRQSVPAALEATWQPGASGFYDNEHPIVNRLTGQVRIIHAQARLIRDADGNPAFLNGTAQDVTEQRQLQQELERQVQERTQQLQASIRDLERSNQNLQQFAYVASHDLQEPLRKIQSFGDILANQYSEQLNEGVDLLRRMQSAAGRMSILIKDLLTYSRISTRQETDTPIALANVVRAVLTDLELAIEEAGAEVTVGPLPTVAGDPSQLGQLFQNLLSNALKFRRTEASGEPVTPTIRIEERLIRADELPPNVVPARASKTYHEISVADNGIGFENKFVDRIFQVFQRLHGRSEYAGTGIGLAICAKVVANHGGAITATSQPGVGATFYVYLPV